MKKNLLIFSIIILLIHPKVTEAQGNTFTTGAGTGSTANLYLVGIGVGSQVSGTTGTSNTSVGNNALQNLTKGTYNCALGTSSLEALSDGYGVPHC
jgi:L-aminopeptidase/D-esterase-like protein